MRNIKDLIKKAQELKEDGLSTGEISDELNVSRETALWLVTYKEKKEGKVPADIYIDWSTIASSLPRLESISTAMTDLIFETLKEEVDEIEVVVGIATSGIPLATLIAQELETSLAIIKPKKYLRKEEGRKYEGHLLTNFAEVKGKKVVLVDDIVTSGSTIKDSIKLLKEQGAESSVVVVIIDKKGISQIDNTPVKALIEAGIVEEMG